MHIKVDTFLALTAMLASTHVAAVGCVVQADDDDELTSDESDGTEATEASPEAGSSETEMETDSMQPATDAGESDGGDDADEPDEPTKLDAGLDGGADGHEGGASDEHEVADAGNESVGDDAGTVWNDAGTGLGDASSEAPPECLGGDFADEISIESCFVFDSCFELGFVTAQETCYDMHARHREGVFDAFWDCYTTAAVSDPCSEEADATASSCASFAIEGACLDEVPGCAAQAELCSNVSEADCNAALAPYVSSYRQWVLDCSTFRGELQSGPDYEGCDSDFYSCVSDPSFE